MENIISNENVDILKVENAKKIIIDLQNELMSCLKDGCGPFLAAIYDSNNNLIAKCVNSVVKENCSNNHAEMNTIKLVQEKLKTYDLAPFNFKMYITAEPCMMCLGAIMWSGIKEIYYSVSSEDVEKITGFDEGFKPKWLEEFKKRGITVYGNIEADLGKNVLQEYVRLGNTIYKPSR